MYSDKIQHITPGREIIEEREEEKGGGIGRQCMRRVGMRGGGGGSKEEFLRVGTGNSSSQSYTLIKHVCRMNNV